MEIQRFARLVAATWVLQVSREIRRHSEMQVVVRRDLQATVGAEQHFEIVRGGRKDRQVKASSSETVDIGCD